MFLYNLNVVQKCRAHFLLKSKISERKQFQFEISIKIIKINTIKISEKLHKNPILNF